MSMLKLAVYGGLGYLAYQLFFAELEPVQKSQGGTGQKKVPQRGEQSRQGQPGGSRKGQRMTGGGGGMNVATKEPGGASTMHRVGRGVV